MAKIISKINKYKGSGGTAAPGLYALRIDPKLVEKIHSKNNLQTIVVSGTNGKTTTARLISAILSEDKQKIIHNRQGSNLLRGVASTLIENSNLFGKVNYNIALWEADEAALIEIASQVKPKYLILLNLFRDQLDRYGEINTVRTRWIEVVKNLPKEETLILNVDDPSINYLKDFAKCKTVLFGVEAAKLDLPTVENVADVKYCIKCGKKLTYTKLYSAHLGIYKCPNCSFKRSFPQVKATQIDFGEDFSTQINLSINGHQKTFKYPLPGLYNVYNVLAALSLSSELNIEQTKMKKSLSNFSAAFGRFQRCEVNGKQIIIFLIKNPAGANEVIRTISKGENLNLHLVLNDNIADGHDVSWIWDTNWEPLAKITDNLFVSGTRSFDMANRLKYAGFKINKNQIKATTGEALKTAIENTNPNGQLIILPTYTALLEIENTLKEMGVEKWQNQ